MSLLIRHIDHKIFQSPLWLSWELSSGWPFNIIEKNKYKTRRQKSLAKISFWQLHNGYDSRLKGVYHEQNLDDFLHRDLQEVITKLLRLAAYYSLNFKIRTILSIDFVVQFLPCWASSSVPCLLYLLNNTFIRDLNQTIARKWRLKRLISAVNILKQWDLAESF